jgi:enamine deaminase RidA (YjgF/YER057c/UK114 family)
MTRRAIVPPGMEPIFEQFGYTPGLLAGGFLFCAGQVGRDADLRVVADPEAQFAAAWDNLRAVLTEAGCGFADVVDLVTYHVEMSRHFDAFKTVKNRVFPRQTCPWTAIGVSELARPGMLVEIKAIALPPGASVAG